MLELFAVFGYRYRLFILSLFSTYLLPLFFAAYTYKTNSSSCTFSLFFSIFL